MATDDLVARLRAHLDEVEQQARRTPKRYEKWRISGGALVEGPYVLLAAHHVEQSLGSHRLAHIARWDPSTVLRLVAYFRSLIDEHDPEGFKCSLSSVTGSPCPDLVRAASFWLGEDSTE